MKSAHAVIADVPDFWMDQGDDGGMELGEHNADRIINALNEADYVIAHHSLVRAEPVPACIKAESRR